MTYGCIYQINCFFWSHNQVQMVNTFFHKMVNLMILKNPLLFHNMDNPVLKIQLFFRSLSLQFKKFSTKKALAGKFSSFLIFVFYFFNRGEDHTGFVSDVVPKLKGLAVGNVKRGTSVCSGCGAEGIKIG